MIFSHLIHTFGHTNIVRGVSNWTNKDGCRLFLTVESMNQTLVDAINRKVGFNDRLYLLGDFSVGAKPKIEHYATFRAMINCKEIHYVRGNHSPRHDKYHRDKEIVKELERVFDTVQDLLVTYIHKTPVTMCHYAMTTWEKQGKGAIQLYGHSHGNLPSHPEMLQMDVGVDTRDDWEPYSWNEIRIVMEGKLQRRMDHHNRETT